MMYKADLFNTIFGNPYSLPSSLHGVLQLILTLCNMEHFCVLIPPVLHICLNSCGFDTSVCLLRIVFYNSVVMEFRLRFFLTSFILTLLTLLYIYTPCLKNVPPLVCYNFDTHEWILIFLAEMLPIK